MRCYKDGDVPSVAKKMILKKRKGLLDERRERGGHVLFILITKKTNRQLTQLRFKS